MSRDDACGGRKGGGGRTEGSVECSDPEQPRAVFRAGEDAGGPEEEDEDDLEAFVGRRGAA